MDVHSLFDELRDHRFDFGFARPFLHYNNHDLSFGLLGRPFLLVSFCFDTLNAARFIHDAFVQSCDGVAINDLRVVIGGLTGVLLVSGDAGETFRLTQQEDRRGVSALLPGPAGSVVVAGEGGVRVIPLSAGEQ